MFNFLSGLRKDPTKKSPEKETDGFVIIGETVEEQRQKTQNASDASPSTNVIVQPSKSYSVYPPLPTEAAPPVPAAPPPAAELQTPLPELLWDVPFTLAPHVLAMQSGFSLLPDLLFSRDVNDSLASFRYDFTLENSVLCEL